MRAPGWRWERSNTGKTYDKPTAPQLSVEANPVVATLLGPDGQVLSELHARPVVDFGFCRADTDPEPSL